MKIQTLHRAFQRSQRSAVGPGELIWYVLAASLAWAGHVRAGFPPDENSKPGSGFVTLMEAPESDVLQAVREVDEDQIVHGTYQYEREKTLSGATSANSSPLFGPWKENGKVFYKVCKGVLAPRHFVDSGDIGTIAVRYVVSSVAPGRTRVRIDAIFVEDARRRAHPSDGMVESSEFKAIQEHLQAIRQKAREEEAQKNQDETAARLVLLRKQQDEMAQLESARDSAKELEKRVENLRRQVDRRVKEAGAQLKSAPFQSAATLQSLPAGSEVVILIVSPYWYGVETQSGQRGWIHRSQLGPLP